MNEPVTILLWALLAAIDGTALIVAAVFMAAAVRALIAAVVLLYGPVPGDDPGTAEEDERLL